MSFDPNSRLASQFHPEERRPGRGVAGASAAPQQASFPLWTAQQSADADRPAPDSPQIPDSPAGFPESCRAVLARGSVPRFYVAAIIRGCRSIASNSTASLSHSSAIKSQASISSDLRASAARFRHSSAFLRYRSEDITDLKSTDRK
jgi:hypothetical protein